MFTENDCTDILAMPDGGAIQTIKNNINNLIEKTVDNNIEVWYGETAASKSLRRTTLLKALGETWTWFRTVHKAVPFKIALRTGQVFELNDDKIKQFEKCKYRGYLTPGMIHKNPFADKTFEEAREE